MPMDLILPRRRFIAGAVALLAAPAIVRYSSLMPVSQPRVGVYPCPISLESRRSVYAIGYFFDDHGTPSRRVEYARYSIDGVQATGGDRVLFGGA